MVYASRATVPFSDDMLRELLNVARERNTAVNVTGALYYTERSFFQVLEGPREAVLEIFERIGRDKRHDNVALLRRREVTTRSFEHWAMGFTSDVHRADELASRLEGFSSFLVTGTLGEVTAHSDSVRELLLRFREGRYRRGA